MADHVETHEVESQNSFSIQANNLLSPISIDYNYQ